MRMGEREGEKHQNRCQGPRQRRQEGAMSRLLHGWPDENVEPSAGIDCRWSNLEADDEGSTEAKHRMLRGVACLCEHPGKPRLACPGAFMRSAVPDERSLPQSGAWLDGALCRLARGGEGR